MAFIDLTKAFDLVSRRGLFSILDRIGCPPKLLSILRSFHENQQCTIIAGGDQSQPFTVISGVKQGCVLAPTLFGIFFSCVLHYAFNDCPRGVYLHTRSDGKLFNLARLKAKTRVRSVLIRELLFADDAALVTHNEQDLQTLIDRFSLACREFGLTISIKKTKVLCQGVDTPPSILIDGQPLEVVDNFTYLGSTVTSNASLDAELNTRIARATATMARLTKRAWSNPKLTTNTKIRVYEACVLSTLLYGSEAWAIYSSQEHRLNSFHLRCLRRILNIRWQDRVTNNAVLEKAKTVNIHSVLLKRRLRWLGHVNRMADGRIPKDLLYGELVTGKRKLGRPHLRFKDVCKRDMKSAGIDWETWEQLAPHRDTWRHVTSSGTKYAELKRRSHNEEKRLRRKRSQPQ